jgi:DNA replication protein DnaC
MTSGLDGVRGKLEQLRLGSFSQALEKLAESDPAEAQRVAAHLDRMATTELAWRRDRAVQRRIQEAHFGQIKTVETFDFEDSATTRKLKARYLKFHRTDVVHEHLSSVFYGATGLGKTHLAKALGYETCQRNQWVLFEPCAKLLNCLVAAEATKDLERAVRRYVSPSLLILDEVGYVAMSVAEASLFFQVVSRRHELRRPCILTTNKPFQEWNQVFHGDATAHVIVDRLTERAEIFYLEGESYRKRHRQGLGGS